jgi:hypothetical protein
MKFKFILLISLLIVSTFKISGQLIDKKYRTTRDSSATLHFITFYKDKTVRLNYAFGPGVYWDSIIIYPQIFSYELNVDTIYIKPILGNFYETSRIHNRLVNSKFIIISHNRLFDPISGYTYVPNYQAKRINKTPFVLNNKIYFSGKYSFVLNHKLKEIDTVNYTIKILKGKSAFDKYGIKAINGIIEINKK